MILSSNRIIAGAYRGDLGQHSASGSILTSRQTCLSKLCAKKLFSASRPTSKPTYQSSVKKSYYIMMRPPFFICRNCRQTLLLRVPRSRKITTATTPQTESPKIPPLRDLTPKHLSYYWDTSVPTSSQLAYADKLFTPSRHSPIKLWSAAKFRTTPLSSIEPEVAFLGRSNVGKSSLLNAIMGKEMCWTSSKPGRTREMNAFGIGGTKGGESKIVLLDMPGYGKASRREWGEEIMKYLQGRKQLRRAFLLIDSEHGIKPTDAAILSLFRQYAIPHQIIMSKVDKLLVKKKTKPTSVPSVEKLAGLRATLERLRPVVQPDGRNEGPGALGELLTCSAETPLGPGKFLGISSVRWAILSAAGLDGTVEARVELISPGLREVDALDQASRNK